MAPVSWEMWKQARSGAYESTYHKGPRVPNPGHGHRHLTHLAAGLRLGGYATQPEDFSACYLNQEDPFEQP